MNYYFIIAGLLLIVIGLVHSILGERVIVVPILHLDLPPLLGSVDLMQRTIRLAWHATTLAWFGFAAILFYYATSGMSGNMRTVIQIICILCVITGLLSLILAYGKHFSWWAFWLIAGLIWLGL